MMTNNNLTLDTIEPLSPIERLSNPEGAFDEEDSDAHKIDQFKSKPS